MKQMRNSEEILQDAIIKLAAAKYVESEGNKILEEERRLNESDEDEITVEEIKKFEKLCDKELKKQKKTISGRKLWLYRVAAAVAVLLLIVNISVVTVPAMRGWVWDFITQMNEEGTAIKTKNVNDEHKVQRVLLETEYGITYVPKGFKVSSEARNSEEISINYYDDKGNIIFFNQQLNNGALNIDTEYAQITEIDINGISAILSVKENRVLIYWEDEGYFIGIEGFGVSQKEMLKVAKSVKNIE